MEKYCKDNNVLIGTRGCDLTALDPAAIIFTPKRLPTGFHTTFSTDPVEAIKVLIYGDLATETKGCPIIYDQTLTPTDNSEGAVVGSYGAGFQHYIRGGNMIYQFDLPQKFCKAKKMMGLNSWDGGVVFLTKDNRIVFGDYVGGQYIPFQLVTNYVTPKMFDNRTDPTLISIYVNLGELDNVYPKIWVSETIDDIVTLDMEGVIDGKINILTAAAGSVTLTVEDSCTGADITAATYTISGTEGYVIVQIKPDGTRTTLTTGAYANGVITVTGAFADLDVLEILAGVSSDLGVDAGNDICCFYAKSEALAVTP